MKNILLVGTVLMMGFVALFAAEENKKKLLCLLTICLSGCLSLIGQTDRNKIIKPLEASSADYRSLHESLVSPADMFDRTERLSEPWKGFHPELYRDLSFYDKDGIAHLRGRVMDYRKWLRKEEIGGEHIFVNGDDWSRLHALFNFSGVPFGVIIDKKGNVL